MTKTNTGAKAPDGYGAEFLHHAASTYFQQYGDIPPMECCTYTRASHGGCFSCESLRFRLHGLGVWVISHPCDSSIEFVMFDGDGSPAHTALVSTERLPSVMQALSSGSPAAHGIRGAGFLHRIASMYYSGIPGVGDCRYTLYCLNADSHEEIRFHFSGYEVVVRLGHSGFLEFCEYDGDRLARYDCVSPKSPDYAPHIAQLINFRAAAGGAGAAGGTQGGAPPLSSYSELLDDFLDAAAALRGFMDPSPHEPAYMCACIAYSEVLCRLFSFAFPSGIRVQAEVVPEYISGGCPDGTVALCRCGGVVGSSMHYCCSCGALLRWDGCDPGEP